MRRRVLLLYRSLEGSTHYQLLGVERTADRKAVKRAYFELAAKLHPDRYFRKKLGSFKPLMEAVFARMTFAHDALSNAEKRAEYDTYLEEQRRSKSIEELLTEALAEAQRAEEAAERAAREEEGSAAGGARSSQTMQASQPAQAPPAAPPSQPSLGQSSKAPSNPTIPVANVDVAMAARRDALAQRLLGGRGRAGSGVHAPVRLPGTPSPAPPPPGGVAPRPSANDAMAALRRRYEERKTMAKAAQARSYVAKAQDSLAAGDLVAAANSYRVALTLTPDDAAIQETAREVQGRADDLLATTYERQAQYEERNSQWTEAARSWGRVARVRPSDPVPHERAANAMVKADGDLHEAGRLAQQACAIEPQNAQYRITMATVYLAAGLTLNARRELETATQLSPQDGTIQAMLKRIGKSG